jgi:hypothetical protein
MEYVILKTNGRLYRIPKAPYEPISQTCERGWTIAKSSKEASETESMDKQKKKDWENKLLSDTLFFYTCSSFKEKYFHILKLHICSY